METIRFDSQTWNIAEHRLIFDAETPAPRAKIETPKGNPKEKVDLSKPLQEPALTGKKAEQRKAEIAKDQKDRESVFASFPGRVEAAARIKHGSDIFNKLSCTDCHSLEAGGGTTDAPSLFGIGSRLQKEQILNAILNPSDTFAAGFEPEIRVVNEEDGQTISGVEVTSKNDNPNFLYVKTDDGEVHQIARKDEYGDDIPVSRGLSDMPVGQLDHLSVEDRDALVAYLKSQNGGGSEEITLSK